MKPIKHIVFLLLAVLAITTFTSCVPDKKPINMTETVLGHLGDDYEWHIASWNDQHITIPLPVIVQSQATGQWHVFSSARFHDQPDGVYENFYIDPSRQGKVFEKGFTERPWDLSITKDVLQIWINVVILLTLFLYCARWYRKHDTTAEAPGGVVGAMEFLVTMIYDDVIVPSVGEKESKKFAPYLLTVFFFILLSNLMGLIPIFPGGANVTGNISITLLLSVFTLLMVNLFGNKEYWKEIFWPDVPIMMKFPVPLMPVIELIGIFTKPFALMIRLFANMFGGHTVILSLTCIIFITWQISAGLGATMSSISFILVIFMNLLELLVAFIQAYVFTMLSAVFIGLAHPAHESKK